MTSTHGGAAELFVTRWAAIRAAVVIASFLVVMGGVVAAVTRPFELDVGPWLAAYLVLVGGVAQVALGLGQAWIAAVVPGRRLVQAESMTWNLGVAAVIVGTLATAPAAMTLGGVSLAVGLGLFLGGVRRIRSAPSWVVVLYRGVIAILLVSIPVGVGLAWLRHG
jgi:hypothetical protein